MEAPRPTIRTTLVQALDWLLATESDPLRRGILSVLWSEAVSGDVGWEKSLGKRVQEVMPVAEEASWVDVSAEDVYAGAGHLLLQRAAARGAVPGQDWWSALAEKRLTEMWDSFAAVYQKRLGR